MLKVSKVGLGCFAVAVALIGSAARAALIPNAISGVNGYAGSWADFSGETQNVADGAAITVSPPNSTNPNNWSASNNWQLGWQENFNATQGVADNTNWWGADLGSVQSHLGDAVIWNTREVTDRGSQTVNVYYATSPTVSLSSLQGSPATFTALGGWTLLGTYVIPQSPPTGLGNAGDGSGPDDFIDLSGISAEDIVFQIESNYGSNIRAGFAGIQFAIATPEPSSIVAFAGLGGMGLIALVVRHRRRKA